MLAVFTGPSLPARHVRDAVPHARVHPPACRGDVQRAVDAGATTILLIDGGFAHRLAVAPSEIVGALRAGVAVVGAASLGAIRAAECHPAGMRGIGAIQRLYRLHVLADDDEVAVATEPERDFRASTVALINVRFAVLRGLRAGLLDRAQAGAMLTSARRLHFSERLWEPVLAAADLHDHAPLRELCLATDLKRRDAERAVAIVAAQKARVPPRAGMARQPADQAPPAYVAAVADHEALMTWLVASGRYRRYWNEVPGRPADAWRQLARSGELEYELMRWHAVERGVQLAGPEPADADADAAPVQARVAQAHGFADWAALEDAASHGHLPSGVPVAAVRDAVRRLTVARGVLCSDTKGVSDRQLHSGFRGFRQLHALQSTQWGTALGAADLA